jgi:hypothetical protein
LRALGKTATVSQTRGGFAKTYTKRECRTPASPEISQLFVSRLNAIDRFPASLPDNTLRASETPRPKQHLAGGK